MPLPGSSPNNHDHSHIEGDKNVKREDFLRQLLSLHRNKAV